MFPHISPNTLTSEERRSIPSRDNDFPFNHSLVLSSTQLFGLWVLRQSPESRAREDYVEVYLHKPSWPVHIAIADFAFTI